MYIVDEKSNLPQICLVQICCKYEICKALQPVQRWRWPNLHKNGQIRPSPHLHWVQSCAKLILATYLHQENLRQIRFFILISQLYAQNSLRTKVCLISFYRSKKTGSKMFCDPKVYDYTSKHTCNRFYESIYPT